MKKRIFQITLLSLTALFMMGATCKTVEIEIPVVGSIDAPFHFQSNGGSGGMVIDFATVSTAELLNLLEDQVGSEFRILESKLQSVTYTLTEKAALSYTPGLVAFVDDNSMSDINRLLFNEPALNTTLNTSVILTPLADATQYINQRMVAAGSAPINLQFAGGITSTTAPVDIKIIATVKIQFIVVVKTEVPDISAPI